MVAMRRTGRGGARLACHAVVATLLALARIAAADTRPDVLLIAIDDLRPALGCYGDRLAKTPHIDRLAAGGRRFEAAYCQQAVCGPSRAALLTGRLPDNTGVWHNRHRFRDLNPHLVTLPQAFKNAGYDTRGMLEFMQVLAQQSGRGGAAEFLSTHPAPESRVRELEQLVGQAPPGGRRSSSEFDRMQQRLAQLPPARPMPRTN